MSPRAAWRLARFGFTDVADYEAGKHDWLAFGLPTEGGQANLPRLKDLARTDIPTCRTDENVSDVTGRLGDWEVAVVVGEGEVVHGLLGRKALAGDGSVRVEEAMTNGPSTFRPHVSLE